MPHKVLIRKEFRKGMRIPEWRVFCDCTWADKAATLIEAERLRTKHINDMAWGKFYRPTNKKGV